MAPRARRRPRPRRPGRRPSPRRGRALRDAVETACAGGGRAARPRAGEGVARRAARRRCRGRRAASGASGEPSRAVVARSAPPAPAPRRRPPRGPAGGAPLPPRPPRAATARSSMVRVDFAKLDQLLNLVGELIVHRTKLADLGRQIAATAPAAGPELLEAVHQVASVSTQLQETIMDVRMLPIRHVFERFPRLVRDLAAPAGQADRARSCRASRRASTRRSSTRSASRSSTCIRNAVDHGIEPPAVRAARGKSPTGTILLSAAQESNQVVITLVDDGGGIDAGEVRRRAIERGILRADEPISDREAIQLIFTEGFSTAADGHRRVGPRRRPRRRRPEHGAAERADRGGDAARRGDEVHAPAAADARDHHGADGRGRGQPSTRCPPAPYSRACATGRTRSCA